MSVWRIERLNADGAAHDASAFSCGEEALDRYLRDMAARAPQHGLFPVTVATRSGDSRILGYYAIDLVGLPEAFRRKSDPPVTVLLVRLAVNEKAQGRGLGTMLLADAVKRALQIDLHWTAFLVRALHERAAGFYRRFGFVPLADDPLLLWLARNRAERLV